MATILYISLDSDIQNPAIRAHLDPLRQVQPRIDHLRRVLKTQLQLVEHPGNAYEPALRAEAETADPEQVQAEIDQLQPQVIELRAALHDLGYVVR